jgi:hypothetical protein
MSLVVVVVEPRDRPCVQEIEATVGPFPDVAACEAWIADHHKVHPHEEFLVTRISAPGSELAEGPRTA